MNRITQPSLRVTRASDVVIGDMQIGALEGDGERESDAAAVGRQRACTNTNLIYVTAAASGKKLRPITNLTTSHVGIKEGIDADEFKALMS